MDIQYTQSLPIFSHDSPSHMINNPIHLAWWAIQQKLLGQHICHLVEERHKHGQIQRICFPLGLSSDLTSDRDFEGWWMKMGDLWQIDGGSMKELRWIYGDLSSIFYGGITNKWVILGRNRSFLSVPTAKHRGLIPKGWIRYKNLPKTGPTLTRPGKLPQKTMERSTMLLMGRSPISMAIFNSKLLVYRRLKITTAFDYHSPGFCHGFSKRLTRENLKNHWSGSFLCPPNT